MCITYNLYDSCLIFKILDQKCSRWSFRHHVTSLECLQDSMSLKTRKVKSNMNLFYKWALDPKKESAAQLKFYKAFQIESKEDKRLYAHNPLVYFERYYNNHRNLSNVALFIIRKSELSHQFERYSMPYSCHLPEIPLMMNTSTFSACCICESREELWMRLWMCLIAHFAVCTNFLLRLSTIHPYSQITIVHPIANYASLTNTSRKFLMYLEQLYLHAQFWWGT